MYSVEKLLKLRLATPGKQASCSMRLLRKQLRWPLPFLFLLRSSNPPFNFIAFSLICLDYRLDTSVFLFLWACFAMFEVVAKAGGAVFLLNFLPLYRDINSWGDVNLICLSIAANGSTRSLKWPMIGGKVSFMFFIFLILNKEPVSGVEVWCSPNTTWMTKFLKVIFEFLPRDTKNKLPTPALIFSFE